MAALEHARYGHAGIKARGRGGAASDDSRMWRSKPGDDLSDFGASAQQGVSPNGDCTRHITCLVADAHDVVRDGIRARISHIARPQLRVVGSAAHGGEALWMIRTLQPDIVVLDLRLPGLSAVDLADRIQRESLRTRLIVYTAHTDPLLALRATRAGVCGFVARGTCDALEAALTSVAQGGTFLDPNLKCALEDPELEVLSDREIATLLLLARGYSNKQVATELGVHLETVKSRVVRILCKLEAGTRTEAVAIAVRRGLLD